MIKTFSRRAALLLYCLYHIFLCIPKTGGTLLGTSPYPHYVGMFDDDVPVPVWWDRFPRSLEGTFLTLSNGDVHFPVPHLCRDIGERHGT